MVTLDICMLGHFVLIDRILRDHKVVRSDSFFIQYCFGNLSKKSPNSFRSNVLMQWERKMQSGPKVV